MSKPFIGLTVVVALAMALIVPISRTNELKANRQGWQDQFKLLEYRVNNDKAELAKINYHISSQYNPMIDKEFKATGYGIGGSVENQSPLSLPAWIVDNYKEIKITEAYAKVIEQKLYETAETARHFKDSLNHTPSIRPVPLDSVHTISSFGLRKHPILHVWKLHEGIDYGAMIGTPVYATADGLVTFSGYDPITGQYIKIEHGYGYTTLYGHLSRRLVVEGEKVRKGQLIGYVGNSGRSDGPHLHYEVRVYGQHVNPVLFIPDPIPAEQKSLYAKRSLSFFIAR